MNIIDIPFRSRSLLSDFSCKDGEICFAEGLSVITSSSESASDGTTSAVPPEFELNYKPEIPSPPNIEFSLVRSSLPGWNIIADAYPSKTVSNPNPTMESWTDLAGGLLAEFIEDAKSSNLFVAPFLILAVWKMSDSTLISPTVPVLLIPNSKAPIVAAPSADTDDSELELRIAAAVCSPCIRISLPEELRSMGSKISSLEIMVSKPLDLYDYAKSLVPVRQLSSLSFCHSLDPTSGVAAERRICNETFPLGWQPRGKSTDITGLNTFYTISSIPFSKLVAFEGFSQVSFNTGTPDDIYDRPGYHPSYSGCRISSAVGALNFKGRKLLWGPEITIPPFADISQSSAYSTEDRPPRWIFHPDPDAKEFQYTSQSGKRNSLPLVAHPSLKGAYYFSGLAEEPVAAAVNTIETGSRKVLLTSYIWLSQKREYPVFDDSSLLDAECGAIIALCRAFRSSALAATVYPTIYLFTDSGVYLFKQNGNDIFSEAGLITTYRLKDATALSIQPKGILFLSIDGETVKIEGTSVKTLGSSGVLGSSGEISLAGRADLPAVLVTRPIKINGAGKFKLLRTLRLRGDFKPAECDLSVYGSRDMIHWYPLGHRTAGNTVCCIAGRSRFFRVEIKMRPTENFNLQGLTVSVPSTK